MSATDPIAARRVHRLSEDVANKIAAGEVVERPASVVKELVENALDAGARRIDVAVEEGGRRLVEVVDDGHGMGPEDAVACLERHATSKITGADDLFSIRTLGFRGEALPSIAAVSRMTLLTREAGSLEGTRVVVEGGRLVEQTAAGAPEGTRVRIADLFFGVPARRKFLRRAETEMGHVSEVMVRLALAHPHVGFSLTHNGRLALSSPAGDDPTERIAAALGRDVHPHLYPAQGRLGDVMVSGHLASPEITRTSARGIYTFVNRRYVKDRQLTHAVTRAYGELVDRGRSPVVVLFIDLPPDEVDVNVHPQKTEVRFANGRQVYDAVLSTLTRSLREAPWGAGRRYELQATERGPERDGYAAHRERVLSALARFGAAARAGDPPAPLFGAGPTTPWPAGAPSPTSQAAGAWAPGEASSALFLSDASSASEQGAGGFGRLRVIGQLAASYILAEGPGGLVVIDQHAAHERVAFERLRAAHAARNLPVQQLLIPRTFELSLAEASALEPHLEALEAAGFDLSGLGGGTFAVRTVPAGLGEADVRQVLLDFLEEVTDLGASGALEQAFDRILATVACHSVVRAGQTLTVAECAALLRDMDPIPFRANCPHGRPVAFELSTPELEKRFGRR